MPIRIRSSTRAASIVLVSICAVVLAGWFYHSLMLPRLVAQTPEMRANTAICFFVLGAQLLSRPYLSHRLGIVLTISVGTFIAVIGLASGYEYLSGVHLGIDELFLRDFEPSYPGTPGRMSPYSAVAFVALGICVIGRETARIRRFILIVSMIPLLIGSLALVGYLWNIEELRTERTLPPVALDTAVCLLLAGVAVLPDLSTFSPFRRLTLEARIGFAVGLGIVVMTVAGVYNYRTSVSFANSRAWVTHTQEVRATLADLFGTSEGIDLAARDYILTADAAKLAEYHALAEKADRGAAVLSQLVSDNPEQSANVEMLRHAIEDRVSILDAALRANDDVGAAAAHSVFAATSRRISIDDLRQMASRMDDIENRLLTMRESNATAIQARSVFILLLTMSLGSLAFFLMMRTVYRETVARRTAERVARDSEATNRSMIEESPDCIAVLSETGEVTQINSPGLTLLALSEASMVGGRPWASLWDSEYADTVRAAVNTAAAGSSTRLTVSRIVSGERRWCDLILMPLKRQDGKPVRVLSVARDITDFKQVEYDLRAANRFLDSLFENLPVMASVKDARTLRFMRVNQAAADFLGFTKSQMIGRTLSELLINQGSTADDADRQAVEAGKLVRVSHKRVVTPRHGHKTVDTVRLPVLDDAGAPLFLLTIVVDVSERQLAEDAIVALNERLQQQADQVQSANVRLAIANKELETANKDLESFSFSVSHDLRAPLRAVDGFAEVLFDEYKDVLDAEGRRYLAIVRDGSRRMGALIEDLLQFSRMGRKALQYTTIESGELVRQVITEALADHVAHAAAPQILVDSLPKVRGDASLFRQVWVNLIGNALKYSSRAAQPVIEIAGEVLGAEVHFSIRDNGVGFDPKYADRLFGVFQRLHTDREFEGTGVGLAIVDRIVRRHGGQVWAQGKVDSGAVFTFAVPVDAADIAAVDTLAYDD